MENRFSGGDILEAPRVKRCFTTPAPHPLLQLVVLFLPSCLLLVVLVFAGVTFASPSDMLGTLQSDPATPTPGVPFTLELILKDADQGPINSARVQAEIYRKNAFQDAAIRTEFKMTGTPGTYRTKLRLPEAGPWTVRLQERTFTHEDVAVEVGFSVRPARNPPKWEFVFAAPSPPTFGTWLLWVVGVPLLAGAVVTVSVFARSRKTRPE